MKQTAVEWLYEKVWKDLNFSISSSILDQAKEMEKQQILDFACYFRHEVFNKKDLEQYYNKTFKSK